MDVSFRGGEGGSSHSEIVDWLKTKKRKRDEGRWSDDDWYVCLSGSCCQMPSSKRYSTVSMVWCTAVITRTKSRAHSIAWLCSGGSRFPFTMVVNSGCYKNWLESWSIIAAGKTAALLCGRLRAMFWQQWFFWFHNGKPICLSYLSLIMLHDVLHHNMAWIIYLSYSSYIHTDNLAAHGFVKVIGGAPGDGHWGNLEMHWEVQIIWS